MHECVSIYGEFMKKIQILGFFVLLLTPLSLWGQFGGTKGYDVEAVYGVQNVEYGSLALDSFGNMVDVDKLLIPIQLNRGKYSVIVSKKNDNLYEIVGKDIYIKTKFCFEFSYNSEAVLDVTNSYGYSVGKLYFIE
jgi:hypothetical protein